MVSYFNGIVILPYVIYTVQLKNSHIFYRYYFALFGTGLFSIEHEMQYLLELCNLICLLCSKLRKCFYKDFQKYALVKLRHL